MDYTKTLGYRNNNPTNIRYDARNKWIGQTGSNKGFCVFSARVYCYRATFKIIRKYIGRGMNTPRKIIEAWAPSFENNVEKYCSTVARRTSLKMDAQVTATSPALPLIVYGMCKAECSYDADMEVIDEAWKMVN